MIKQFIRTFNKPPAVTLAQESLEEAQRKYLLAMEGLRYATNMVEFHRAHIEDLQRFLADPNSIIQPPVKEAKDA